jgi:hypothetical protein
MGTRKRFLAVLSIIPALLACDVFGVPLLTPTASAAVFPTDAPPAIPALTIEQVLNAEYTIQRFDGATLVYPFVDGAYQQGSDPALVDYVSIHLVAVELDQQVVFGDLNGDGADDAAVILAENYGGSGVFVSVAAVVNENGQPRHAASFGIGDRPSIQAIRIQEGGIFLDAVVQGADDPACCPTQAVTRTLKLFGSQLMLVGATSQTPSGDGRVITIDEPLNGAQVPDEIVLRGSVTISPFENNLGMTIYSLDGNELANGHVTVEAPDFGAPGTFLSSLNLAGLPRGPALLIVADYSAADGSILALDSVELVIR